MNFFPQSFKVAFLSTLWLSPSIALSDTFVMSDGKELKGTILKQTYEHYFLKIEIAENVLGEKKVLKKDVKTIIPEDKSEKAFQKIKALMPIQDLMKASDYDKIHSKYFKSFLNDFPESKHLDEVIAIEEQFNEEREIITNGGLKISGKLLNQQQINANRYEVMAIVEFQNIKRYVKTGKYLSAMRTFEKMEANYKQTRPFREAVKSIRSALPKLRAAVNTLHEGVDQQIKQRDNHLAALPSDQIKRIKDLLTEEDAEYHRILADAKAQKTKWLPLNKYVKEPLATVLKNIDSEDKRLETISNKELKDAGKIYRDILQSISAKDHEKSTTLLKDFTSAKPRESYITALKIEILAIQNEAQAKIAREQEALRIKKEQEAIERKKKAEEAALKKAEEKMNKNKGKKWNEKLKNKFNINKKEQELKDAEKLLNE